VQIVTTDVAIVQPYIPEYRVPFFEGLRINLADQGIRLRVIAGRPSGSQAARDDAATLDWLTLVRPKVLRVGQRQLSFTDSRRYWGDVDAVVVPHQGSSLDALNALASRNRPVGVWGHIAPYTSPPNPADAAVERWQLRRAHHVFAYTRGGSDFALRAGVHPNRVTTVMNTIDSAALSAEIDGLGPEDINSFKLHHGIPDGPLLAYVGGLDGSKRVGLLAAALELLHEHRSSVHVIIAGAGEDRKLLSAAVAHGQVTEIGYAGTHARPRSTDEAGCCAGVVT